MVKTVLLLATLLLTCYFVLYYNQIVCSKLQRISTQEQIGSRRNNNLFLCSNNKLATSLDVIDLFV